MGQTPIEWSDYTFNPVWGCEKISPGCKNCYAMAWDKRVGGDHWGPGKPRRKFSDHHWAQPLAWEAKAKRDGRIYRVFCASMADWLEDHPQWIEPRRRLEALVAATPNLIWLFLTKRPENWRLMPESWQNKWPSNAMFGFTGENDEWFQKRWSHWAELASRSRGIKTFISAEPLLGALRPNSDFRFIKQVICGGESGAGARPMHPDWARGLRDNCAAAGVPFLFKQWGEWSPRFMNPGDAASGIVMVETRADGSQYGTTMTRVGKKRSGRLLDGVEHNGLPLYWPSYVGLIEPDPLKIVA